MSQFVKFGWSAAVLLVGVALSGCAGTEGLQDFGSVEAPERSAGHAYGYDVEGELDARGAMYIDGSLEDRFADNVTLPRQPAVTMEILNASYGPDGAFYLGAVQFAGAPDSLVVDGFASDILGKLPIAIRKSDLAEFAVTTSQTQACDPGCRLAVTDIEVGNETELDPYLDFPLTAGKAWDNRIPLDTTHGGDLGMDVHSLVRGVEAVDGPDGPVDAVHVASAINAPDLAIFNEAAAQDFASQGAEDVTVDARLTGSIDTRYADDVGEVVQERIALDLRLDVGFTADGQRFEMEVRSIVELTFHLAAVDLSIGDEHDDDALRAFFSNGVPVRDPRDEAAPAAGAYAIRVTADRAEFNVADDGDVKFNVEATPALPPDDTIIYTVSDAFGEVSTGAGSEFEVSFRDPGLYSVTVQAIDGDRVVQAADQMLVAADHDETVDMNCAALIVAAADQGSCGTPSVPMRTWTGLRDAAITIDASNTAGDGGTLVVEDGAGNTVEMDASDGSGTLTLDDLQDLEAGDDWSVSWQRDIAVQEDASLDVLLDYGPETASSDDGYDGGGEETRGLLQGQWDSLERRLTDLLTQTGLGGLPAPAG